MTVLVPIDAQQPAVPRHVRHALAHMRANLREKITLADLASVCGISQRALLTQFKRFLGVSPIAHLLRMRLAAARVELQASDESASISDIAARCGLTHLGRFAAEYREAFGELPSATPRRGRGRGASNGNGAEAVLPAPFVFRRKPSLVVLPLRTETLAERRIAQALAEQLAATLSSIRVASVSFADPSVIVVRQAAWSPDGPAAVQYCLHGRLVQRDDRTRVTIWLMDAEGRHVWGDSYDGVGSLLDLFQRVVDGVLLGVVPGITGAEIERIRDRDPRTLAAREMLMRAFPTLPKIDVESTRGLFVVASRAMELDPDDALPFAVGAYCQARLYNSITTPAGTRDTAVRLSSHAGALDTGDPLVATARAAVATLLGLCQDAEFLAERALAMDPTSGWAHERAAYHLLSQAKPEAAIGYFGQAMRLHGMGLPRENCFHGLAQAHHAADRPEEAVRWARRAFAENPRAEIIHRYLICLQEGVGNHSEAQRLAAELRRAHPDFRVSHLAEVLPNVVIDHLRRAGLAL